MIPKIVSSIPQNGAEDVALNSVIKITFSTNIAWSLLRTSNFIIDNVTRNTKVLLDEAATPFEVDASSLSITLYPLKTEGHYLEGGCTYKISIINIRDSNMVPTSETYSFTFKTIGLSPVIDEPEEIEEFRILFTYPRYNAINIEPNVIRIRYTQDIDKTLIDYDIESPNCVLTVLTEEEDPETGEQTLISGSFDPEDLARTTDIVFVPDSLAAGQKYIVSVKSVPSDSGPEISESYSFPFKTKGEHTFTTIKELKNTAPVLELLLGDTPEETIYERLDMIGKSFEEYCTLNGISYDPTNPSIYFVEYIKCYFVYDVILDRITSINTNAQSKRLGDLEISYASNLSDLLKLLDIWLRRASKALEMLKGNYSGVKRPAAFIRGEGIDTVYEFMNRALQVEESDAKEW